MLVRQFHAAAAQGSGVLIGTCAIKNHSGCHDFCRNLATELNLDFIMISSLDVATSSVEQKEETSKWKKLFISGCQLGKSADLIKMLHFTAIDEIYLIVTPWLSKRCTEHYDVLRGALQRQICKVFQIPDDKIKVLTSGIDNKASHCIGLPRPYPILDSKYEIDDHCFGLIYIRHINAVLSKIGNNDLQIYFSQIALAAKVKGYKDNISVLAIETNLVYRKQLQEIADEFGITVKYLGKKLPQGDFIQVMKLIAEKKGVLAFDGVQSLMQGLYFGAKIFFYNTSVNIPYCQQLIQAITPEYQSIASVLLGLSSDYDLLKDQPKVMNVYQSLQSLINAGIKKFEDDRIAYSATTTDLVESKNVAIKSTATLFSRSLATAVETTLPEKTGHSCTHSLMKYPG